MWKQLSMFYFLTFKVVFSTTHLVFVTSIYLRFKRSLFNYSHRYILYFTINIWRMQYISRFLICTNSRSKSNVSQMRKSFLANHQRKTSGWILNPYNCEKCNHTSVGCGNKTEIRKSTGNVCVLWFEKYASHEPRDKIKNYAKNVKYLWDIF